MRNTMTITALVAASVLISGCTSNEQGSVEVRPNVITAVGAAAGGYVGSRIGKGKGNVAATIIGVLAGGHIGRSFEKSRTQRRVIFTSKPPAEAKK